MNYGTNRIEHYFKEYHALCYRIAFTNVKRHADAEDIAQEVFIRLMRAEPGFLSAEHERAWMIRTTVNLCRDLCKSKWQNATVGMEKVPEAEKAYFQVPYIEEDDTLWAVLELPENYRNCMYLFYYEDYAVKEVAEILKQPENTVKSNLRRGREALKKILEEAGK